MASRKWLSGLRGAQTACVRNMLRMQPNKTGSCHSTSFNQRNSIGAIACTCTQNRNDPGRSSDLLNFAHEYCRRQFSLCTSRYNPFMNCKNNRLRQSVSPRLTHEKLALVVVSQKHERNKVHSRAFCGELEIVRAQTEAWQVFQLHPLPYG